MKKIVLATQNQGKVRELAELLDGMPVQVLSLADFPQVPDVIEDGVTFAENALKKAMAASQATGLPALADDSGLAVDFLDGAPGVHSARFAGPQRSDADNNAKLLELLENVPESRRTARFCCVIAIARPDGAAITASGACEGIIGFTPKGENGFGYDPLFYVPEYGQTFSELNPAVKNQISHRARALQQAKTKLEEMLK